MVLILRKLLVLALFYVVLKPQIRLNYLLRAKGIIPDEWFWADEMSAHFNLFACQSFRQNWTSFDDIAAPAKASQQPLKR